MGLKFQLSVRVELKKLVYEENDESAQKIIDPFFTTITQRYDQHTFDGDLERMNNELLAKYDAFIENGSGYTLHTVDKLFLKLFKYRQLRGGSKLSKEIIRKRACLSIECPDEKCFLYSCLACIYPRNVNVHRLNYYAKYVGKLNTDGIDFSVRLEHFSRFERLNPSISINVLGYDRRIIVPLYHTQKSVAKHEINLLLFNGHYYLV